MALSNTGGGFSSTNTFFFIIVALILISVFPSTFAGGQDEVTTKINSKRIALKADDYRIIKAMMDRCVEIYLDPSSPPPNNLHEDELLVKRLRMLSYDSLFFLASGSGGNFTPEVVHQLKVDALNVIPHFMHERRVFDDNDNITGISNEDHRVLKPVMDSCVKLFLDAYAADWEGKESDISFCSEYFEYMFVAYNYSDKLAPEFVETLKDFQRFYMLDFDERILHRCLILEKHRFKSCNRLRKSIFQKGYTDVFI